MNWLFEGDQDNGQGVVLLIDGSAISAFGVVVAAGKRGLVE